MSFSFLSASIRYGLLLLCLAVLCQAPSLKAATITPVIQPHYRPGSWMEVHATAIVPPTFQGTVVPELVALVDGVPVTTVALAPVAVKPGSARFSFALVPGNGPMEFRFRLLPNQGEAIVDFRADSGLQPLAPEAPLLLNASRLRPSMAGVRVVSVVPRQLPALAEVYENCDVLVLRGGGVLQDRQYRAIAAWLAQGGMVLFLDTVHRDALEYVAGTAGWQLGPARPFRLPAHGRGQAGPALVRQLGRGLAVDLSAGAGTQAQLLAGKGVWKRLRSERLGVQRSDRRLAPAMYRALPECWPDRPVLSAGEIRKWVAVWVGVLLAVWLPLRKREWLRYTAPAVVSVVLALAFLQVHPYEEARVFMADVKRIGESGAEGPIISEQLWAARPFEEIGVVAVDLPAAARPRVLLPGTGAVADTHTEYRYSKDRLRLKIHTGLPVVLLRSVQTGRVDRRLPFLCVEKEESLSLVGQGQTRTLYDVELRTKRQSVKMRQWTGQAFSGSTGTVDSLSTDRTAMMKIVAARYAPGLYATLQGWREPASTKENLGVLEVHTLNRVEP